MYGVLYSVVPFLVVTGVGTQEPAQRHCPHGVLHVRFQSRASPEHSVHTAMPLNSRVFDLLRTTSITCHGGGINSTAWICSMEIVLPSLRLRGQIIEGWLLDDYGP